MNKVTLEKLIEEYNKLLKDYNIEILPPGNITEDDKLYMNPYTDDCESAKISPKEEDVAYDFNLSPDIYVVNENHYQLANKVGETILDEDLDLIFNHEFMGRVVPGITERQLILVLLYKNRNNKERYEQIKKLLNQN